MFMWESTKRSPGSRKMRKSILQFAKKLWSSEDSGTRRALCTNCKTDPVTLSSLCKKCCRRSTVCAACYSRILSLHHTRLDRYGSLEDRTYKCPDCNLSPVNTSPHTNILEDNSVSYITPQKVNNLSAKKADTDPLSRFVNKRTLPSLTSPPPPARMPLSFSTSAPVTPVKPISPVKPLSLEKPSSPGKPLTLARPTSLVKTITPVKPPRPVNHVKPVTLTKQKSFSSSDSEYQSCSENVDPESPFTPTTPTPALGDRTSYVFPGKDNLPDKNKYSYQDNNRYNYNMEDKIMPVVPETIKSPKVLENINNNKCVIVLNKDHEMPRTVAVATKPTPPVSMVTRSRVSNPNRPVMIRSRAIEESDEFQNVMVKRTSMGDNVVLKPEIILPSLMLGKLPDKKENIQTTKPTNGHVIEKEEVNEHQPAVMKRSYSESSKDRRLIATKNEKNRSRHGSVTEVRSPRDISNDTNGTPTTRSSVKRTVRIAEEANIEHSRPCSLELEHVTVGEVTPTVYVKDKNDVIDESIQKSESVLKRSLSVSNSRLQRKLSKKLLNKERNSSNSDETGAPVFLRRNRSSSSVDKSSPPPDLKLMANAGLAMEDIQAFGLMYVQRLENRMRNIDAMKELEKQHNISCRERLKTALDTHEQLSAGLEDVKRQLKECMEKYRFISETFV
ncbi:uncharacterized protein LOC134816042 isoform X3 [Bolinopsis microptera]|uniref:uncharacterized protein LOC134816042 isoform X3 n=1 Tax=Bolinopsis microptera TaxID=2820187 RepID=UPI00307AA637